MEWTIYILEEGNPFSESVLFKNEKKKMKVLSPVWLFATPWTVAYHAPPSMGFSRQEYRSGLYYLKGIQIKFLYFICTKYLMSYTS